MSPGRGGLPPPPSSQYGNLHPVTTTQSSIPASLHPPAPLLWRFTDGKPGHENQSLALVENMQLLAPFRCVEISARTPSASQPDGRDAPPALVLGAGHRTHLALLAAARRFHCPAVVLMKPTIPAAFFDLCLIPQHDLGATPAPNVIATVGMLNRIPAGVPEKQDRGLFLIGGPSKHHGWEAAPLLTAIDHLLTARPDLAWDLTDSRRTPAGFLASLPADRLAIHPCEATGPDWLPRQLLAARDVWGVR